MFKCAECIHIRMAASHILPAMMGLSAVGILLSVYLCVVQYKLRRCATYKAWCDYSRSISCTKVIASRYSRMFILPNACLGIIYYCTVILLSLADARRIVFPVTLLALLVTLYLGYVSLTRLRMHCLVCYGAHAINIALFILSTIMFITSLMS